jgi:CRP/FNR family transcriptional regulator
VHPIQQEYVMPMVLPALHANAAPPPSSALPQALRSCLHPSWRENLERLQQHLQIGRRKLKAQDRVYACGQNFEHLYLVHTGLFKVITLTADGRERGADLVFDGDWLGFDGIHTGRHSCMAVALDMAEVWTIRYDSLLAVARQEPQVLAQVLRAISEQLARNRDLALSLRTLSADARVAEFVLQWARSLAERGRRTDQFTLCMSRADIGDFLGLRLESVSRALTRMAQCGVIEFNERGRREISIPDLQALNLFIQEHADASRAVLQ